VSDGLRFGHGRAINVIFAGRSMGAEWMEKAKSGVRFLPPENKVQTYILPKSTE
jgi:hypothetical protein